MKITRRSRKMLVYSLISFSCLQQLLIAGPTPKPDPQLKIMANGHNNTDLLIDEIQRALGAIDTINAHTTKNTSIAKFIIIQNQRMAYDARFWFSYSQHHVKQENKAIVRRAFIPTIRTAESFYSAFTPDAAALKDLPQNPANLNAIDVIDTLQSAFGSVRNKQYIFLNDTVEQKTIDQITADLTLKHRFFDTFQGSCCTSYEQRQQAIQYKIFLRTHMIPYLYCAQLQCYREKNQQLYGYLPDTAAGTYIQAYQPPQYPYQSEKSSQDQNQN